MKKNSTEKNPRQYGPELVSVENGFGKHPLRPLLRWIGGKRYLTHELARFVPADLKSRVYREPFFGAGSLFFFLRPNRAVLSDSNEDLMNTYRCVRAKPALVAQYLQLHSKRDGKEYYYKIRDEYNNSRALSAAQAARFIYLNRTCFNGIFRVNIAGMFNVPYGHKLHPLFPNQEHVRAAGVALRRAKLSHREFEVALQDVRAGDFIYLDPPYPPLNGTSYFAHYTRDRFHHKDQQRLAAVVKELDQAKCLVLISNADLLWIRRLYRGLNQVPLEVTRYVTTSEKKHKVSELLISNYNLEVSGGRSGR